MFDLTPDDISQLTDVQLRELVARLCEAELRRHKLSPAFVTSGGHQNAGDGGVDVRAALPPGASIDGFIPCPNTTFQVKKQDMPRSAIVDEMRPHGKIRPVIKQLAAESGAYIIASSLGSTSDSALTDRKAAMRDALKGVRNANSIIIDFYDRTRLASWVRQHPALIAWVREKTGKAIPGWRPYGAWSGPAGPTATEYLLDAKMRLHFDRRRDISRRSLADAIDELRDELAKPGGIVRLIGLSGVGKTRLAQALFDTTIGSRALPAAEAAYCNLSDSPSPPPVSLASDLAARRIRAIMVVDNCPPDLHRQLADICRSAESTVSVLTIEYDVGDDQPEGTRVVRLDASSSELIEQLLLSRYPSLSELNATTIAMASGGNARIAIALAETVERSDVIEGMSDEQLFQRLFWQRREPDRGLLRAAQACSLVYSFQSEPVTGEHAELPFLAAIAGQQAAETYQHIAELLRRDLVQRRGNWRAVLPQALANRLADRALQDTPYEIIHSQLLGDNTGRLAVSFTRRLSFLHHSEAAIEIAGKWLAPGGMLGDVPTFDDRRRDMFQNVATVLPEAALAALERSHDHPNRVAIWAQHIYLLSSLAYDPALFERSACLLATVACQCGHPWDRGQAARAFVSLFMIEYSGTHATVEQRLHVIERLLKSEQEDERNLGRSALDFLLTPLHTLQEESDNMAEDREFAFGAHSRDYGYAPANHQEVRKWNSAALELIERLALSEGMLDLHSLVSAHFVDLWNWLQLYDQLERLFRGYAEHGFSYVGWTACRRALGYAEHAPTDEGRLRLGVLAEMLKPITLEDRAKTLLFFSGSLGWDIAWVAEQESPVLDRSCAIARQLGEAVAADNSAFTAILPHIFGGSQWSESFGQGLANGSPDHRKTWDGLTRQLAHRDAERGQTKVLAGYIAELLEREPVLANDFLDETVDHAILRRHLLEWHSAGTLDERAAVRLMRALKHEDVPVQLYGLLSKTRTLHQLRVDVLADLLPLIAEKPQGFLVALGILHERVFGNQGSPVDVGSELVDLGRKLLQKFSPFNSHNSSEVKWNVDILSLCLDAENAPQLTSDIVSRLKQISCSELKYSAGAKALLTVLLERQPLAALDALFGDDEGEQQAGIQMLASINHPRGAYVPDYLDNPADVLGVDVVTSWCETNPQTRYPLAASIVSISQVHGEGRRRAWSRTAATLLTRARDPKAVLETFIDRLVSPASDDASSWELKGHLELLDSVQLPLSCELVGLLREARVRLSAELETKRALEARNSALWDERFE
jgi:hypothetical protein